MLYHSRPDHIHREIDIVFRAVQVNAEQYPNGCALLRLPPPFIQDDSFKSPIPIVKKCVFSGAAHSTTPVIIAADSQSNEFGLAV